MGRRTALGSVAMAGMCGAFFLLVHAVVLLILLKNQVGRQGRGRGLGGGARGGRTRGSGGDAVPGRAPQ